MDDAGARRPPTPRRSSTAEAQRGSVSAEFAAVIPAVLLVLAICLGALQLAGTQLRLQDAAADASRSLARGDGEATAATRVRQAVPGAALSVRHTGDLVCVEARASGGVGAIFGLTVTAAGCALDGGL